MSLHLPDLDAVTREFMLREFDEQPSAPAVLSRHGLSRWPEMMRDAIEYGDDTTLLADLLNDSMLFVSHRTAHRNGVAYQRVVNHRHASERLAASEFNTWYVLGVAARFLDEGIPYVEVVRAAAPSWAALGCAEHEGAIVATREVYDGLRAGTWLHAHPVCFQSIQRPA